MYIYICIYIYDISRRISSICITNSANLYRIAFSLASAILVAQYWLESVSPVIKSTLQVRFPSGAQKHFSEFPIELV